jgi:hypothetical protein
LKEAIQTKSLINAMWKDKFKKKKTKLDGQTKEKTRNSALRSENII